MGRLELWFVCLKIELALGPDILSANLVFWVNGTMHAYYPGFNDLKSLTL